MHVHICGTAHLKQLRREVRRAKSPPNLVPIVATAPMCFRHSYPTRCRQPFCYLPNFTREFFFVPWTILAQHLDAPNCSLFSLFSETRVGKGVVSL
jgi:hypothetical protein